MLLLTNSMGSILFSWEASQKIPNILQNPKIHWPSLPPFLSQINPFLALPLWAYFFVSVLILSSTILHPSSPCRSGFSINIFYAFLFSPMCATFPDHLIILDLIILAISGEEYKLWRFFQLYWPWNLNIMQLFFPSLLLLPSSGRQIRLPLFTRDGFRNEMSFAADTTIMEP